MSFYDYTMSKKISAADFPFYALIMAAMRQADTSNLDRLRRMFPDTWDELDQRYHAPGGLLPDEKRGRGIRRGHCFWRAGGNVMSAELADYHGTMKHIAWMAQTVHQAYHQDIPGNWMNCPRDICASTMYFMALASGPEPAEANP